MSGYCLPDSPEVLLFGKIVQDRKVCGKAELCRLREGRNKKQQAKKLYDNYFFQAVKLLCNVKKKITGYPFQVTGNKTKILKNLVLIS